MPDQNMPAIRVVGLSGSLRDGSYTRLAVQVALRGAAELGAETRLLDLRDYELPFCDGRVNEETCPPDVLRLRRDLRAAQGIILGTPEYHASFSGVLKNALDLMGFDEFEGKMLGLVGVSGGRLGAINALNSLRMVGRALHAWVIPEQVSVAEAFRAFDAEGRPRDSRTESALLEVGRQVARFAFLHNSAQVQEFLRLWENGPVQPGRERRTMMAILLRAAVFALGFALFVVTLTSAVKTFVLPRSATDGLTRAVFLVMRRAFRPAAAQHDHVRSTRSDHGVLRAGEPCWRCCPSGSSWSGSATRGCSGRSACPRGTRRFADSGSSLLTLGFAPVGRRPNTAGVLRGDRGVDPDRPADRLPADHLQRVPAP